MSNRNNYSYDANGLMDILKRLRAPDGCPWDRKQTQASLKTCLAGECAELLEAIDLEDQDGIKEEAGDLLMNILFQVVIAEEKGSFTLQDVWQEIIDKMIRRHVHIFGNEKAQNAQEVSVLWNKVKAQEKAAKSKDNQNTSVLDDVKLEFSSLQRAAKLNKKASENGFIWPDTQSIAKKILEEANELEETISLDNDEHFEEELGDLLFACASMANFCKKDPDELLRKACRKFEKRFKSVEAKAKTTGFSMAELGPEKLDKLWNEVKAEEN